MIKIKVNSSFQTTTLSILKTWWRGRVFGVRAKSNLERDTIFSIIIISLKLTRLEFLIAFYTFLYHRLSSEVMQSTQRERTQTIITHWNRWKNFSVHNILAAVPSVFRSLLAWVQFVVSLSLYHGGYSVFCSIRRSVSFTLLSFVRCIPRFVCLRIQKCQVHF